AAPGGGTAPAGRLPPRPRGGGAAGPAGRCLAGHRGARRRQREGVMAVPSGPHAAAAPAVGAGRRPRRRATRDTGTALLFLLPLFVLAVALIAYPFYRAVWLSYTDKPVGRRERFVALRTSAYLVRDDPFRALARNSLVFTGGAVALK